MLGTLGASLLGNLLAGKEIVRAGSGNKKGIVRDGTGKKIGFLMPPHHLTNFEIQSIIKMNQELMVFFQDLVFR